jgi:virginiamycin A acetyltransferase
MLPGNHLSKLKSLHPYFYNPDFGHVSDLSARRAKYVVENDVWFGQGAIVVPSVTKIENGAIISTGSVVTKNVPPYAIVAGNPAFILGYQFSKEVIVKYVNRSGGKRI